MSVNDRRLLGAVVAAAVTGATCGLCGFFAGWFLVSGGLQEEVHLAPGTGAAWVDAAAERTSARSEAFWAERGSGWQPLSTAFHQIEAVRISLPPTQGRGGAIEAIGEHLVVATPHGALSVLSANGGVAEIDARVPMRFDDLAASDMGRDPRFPWHFFRVLDLLVLASADGTHDLLVAHHVYLKGCIALRVSRLPLDAALHARGDFEVVYTSSPCLLPFTEGESRFRSWYGDHAGGRMLYIRPDTILVSVGDYGRDGVDHSLGLEGTDYGRILEINIRTGAAKNFAEGMRNPQGLWRARDGRIWQTEHGPEGGDELNLLTKGAHYGWPHVTLGVRYGDRPWPRNPGQGRHDSYTGPVFAWTPAIGVSNLVDADPRQFPLWDGDLLVGSLRERTLFRLRLSGERIQYAEPIWLAERIRDLTLLAAGEIAVLTDSSGILILRNSEARGGEDWAIASARAAARLELSQAAPATGAHAVYEERCGPCHALWTESDGIGPHLKDLLGRPVASVNGYNYSRALLDAGGRWTRGRLAAFIADPNEIPGSRMPQLWVRERELELILKAVETRPSNAVQ